MNPPVFEYVDFSELPLASGRKYCLTSYDGHMFYIPETAVELSHTLSVVFGLTSDADAAARLQIHFSVPRFAGVTFRAVSGKVLHLVVQLLYHGLKIAGGEPPDTSFTSTIPPNLKRSFVDTVKMLNFY